MPISSVIATTPRQPVRIVTVDPRVPKIEGLLRDGSIIQISMGSNAFVRWPREGEVWYVEYVNGWPTLTEYVEPTTDAPLSITSILPGEARIDADKVWLSGGLDVRGPLNVHGATAFDLSPTAPTPASGSNNTQLATTAFVQTASTTNPSPPSGPAGGDLTGTYPNPTVAKAAGAFAVGTNLSVGGAASFTGIPTGPTAAVDTNTTQLATTAFVIGQGYLKSSTAASTYQPLDSDLTAVAGLITTGLVARTADGAAAARTITGTTNQVTVTNGDGVAGNPTLALPQNIDTAALPQFANLGLGTPASASGRLRLVAGTTAADGIEFGGDTNLYRSAVDVLRTDDNFVIGGTAHVGGRSLFGSTTNAAASTAHVRSIRIGTGVTTDHTHAGLGQGVVVEAADAMLQLFSNEVGSFGSVVNLYEFNSTTSSITNLWSVGRQTNSGGNRFVWWYGTSRDWNLNTRLFALTSTGTLEFGSAGDTNLFRSAADTLRTDDSLVVGTNLTVAGTAAFTGTPTGPTAAVDTNTTQLATTAFVIGQGYLKASTAGTTYQPLDADLTSIAGQAGTGILARTAADTWATRTITGDTEIVVTNGDGVAGNPTLAVGSAIARLASPAFTGVPTGPTAPVDTNTTQLATTAFVVSQGYLKSTDAGGGYQPLDADLTSISGQTGTGILARTAADTWTTRTIAGTANQVTVTNGDGVAGNPTLSLPQNIHTAAEPQFGRVGLGAAPTSTQMLAVRAGTWGDDTTNSRRTLLDVDGTLAPTSQTTHAMIGGYFTPRVSNVNLTGASTGVHRAIYAGLFVNGPSTSPVFSVVEGVRAQVTNGSNSADNTGVTFAADLRAAAGTVFGAWDTRYGLYVDRVTLGTGGTLLEQYGISVQAMNAGSTNRVGVRITEPTTGATGKTASLWLDSTSTEPRNGILFGSAGDVNLYRSAADVLRTDDTFETSLNVRSQVGSAFLMTMGMIDGNTKVGIEFGAATGLVNLYRSAADTLKTDDALHVGGRLHALTGLTIPNGWGLSMLGGGFMDFSTTGVAAPSATSAGWKLKLYGDTYGFGIDSGTLWHLADARHRIYTGGTTPVNRVTIDGAGVGIMGGNVDGTAGVLSLGGTGESGERIWSNRGGGGDDNYGITFGTAAIPPIKRGFVKNSGDLQWLRPVRVWHNPATESWADACVEIRSSRENGPRARITFHSPNLCAPQFVGHSNNAFYCVNDSNTAWVAIHASAFTTSGERFKEDFRAVSHNDILNRIKKLPVRKFRWKEEKGLKGQVLREARDGIGPTAEDMHRLFPETAPPKTNESNDGTRRTTANGVPLATEMETYSVADAIGVCMAAIQGLLERVESLEAQVAGQTP